MKFREMLAVALEGLRVNKLRSALTMLGMIIGVMFVIIIVTMGQSLNKQVEQEVEGLGANSFTLVPIANDNGQQGKLTLDDCRLLESSIDSIEFVVPFKYLTNTAVFETVRNKKNNMLIGTSPDYMKVSGLGFVEGRFFNNAENQIGRRVIVIDQNLAEELFGKGNTAVGKTLRVNHIPFQVCGVTKPEAAVMGMQQSLTCIPVKTLMGMADDEKVQQAVIKVKSKEHLESATKQSVAILELRHAVKEGYIAQTNEQMMEEFSSILTVITSVFGALAGVALLVGGIGIMNIMLVSVTERTREIGVRAAMGARRRDILMQFLVEAAVISALGGSIGMLLGIGIGAVISLALNMPVIVSFGTMLAAFAFSSAIGIVFGLYPANRAARLNPIDALRYE
ncbi:MAG TPA: ABC transporter permease [Syntrophomonadaceae bacterium]|nr:ABC transporter permease [Syntrophomonadaceae bacterium]HRX21799.1 ABC transporter permease [Syntrophomonadaceae bacterium]